MSKYDAIPIRHRIYIDVTEEEFKVISNKLPRGFRQQFFKPIVEDVVKLLSNPELAVKFRALVINRTVSLWDFNREVNKTKGNDNV